MRGKKGGPHPDPDDPPRRRADKRRGHGTWANARPPAAGRAGRDGGRVYLEALARARRADLGRVVADTTTPGCTVGTDEWAADAHLPELDRAHASACHSAGGWARDDDGDGVDEVQSNATEGRWTGRRSFLRPFRGVSKWSLDQSVAVDQWAANAPSVGWDFIQALLLPNFAP
jgi:transposase